ncbi:hypothetical protein V5738_11105 [Salinisphaera sp. SPP-AMP-43]|uniref:hypothetical protein n=1 Tax=Salinisphaera sp. SPP-AMP-43 TaxID=3121288 RepID=UPI003C6E96D3
MRQPAFRTTAIAQGLDRTTGPARGRQGIRDLGIAIGMLVLPMLVRVAWPTEPLLADDAYYYLVVAERMAGDFTSAFYGHTLTNGYHPLWLGILSLLGFTVGLHEKLIVALGIILSSATIWVVLFYLRPRTWRGALCIAVLIWLPFRGTSAFTGMESGLVLFLGTWALCVLYISPRHDAASLFIGSVLLVLGMAARIDFALIALPALCLAPDYSRFGKLVAGCSYLLLGGAYAVVNYAVFGIALPISGAVKALGGLQINSLFIEQNILTDDVGGFVTNLITMSPTTLVIGVMVGSLVLLGYRAHAIRHRSMWRRARLLMLACIAGGGLYLVKLVFLSSWRTWGWYGYPNGFLVLSLCFFFKTAITPRLSSRLKATTLWLGAAALLPFYGVANATIEIQSGFVAVNHRFVDKEKPRLRSMRLAMGDRAGSLAYFLGTNNIFQMEGLVMDRRYLDELENASNIQPYLCRHGVDVVLDYEPPLGAYVIHRVDVFRPALTQYPSAYVMVRRAQQVFRFHDDRLFPSDGLDRDTILYGWALDCRSRS